MPFQLNNKLAEKWTQPVALELAQKALSVIDNDCFFLSDVADRCGTYRQLFEYLMDKFNEDEDVFNTIKRLFNKCESIVANKTAKGEIVPALGIFILKAYHGLFETSKLNAEVSADVTLNTVEGFKIVIDDPNSEDAPETGSSPGDAYRNKTQTYP